jgi:hypothetical protein
MLQTAATSSSVWAITQPSMQWTRPARKSWQQACSSAATTAVRRYFSDARAIQSFFSSRRIAANGLEPVCSRYRLPRALTAAEGEYKLNKNDMSDSPASDQNLTRYQNLLAVSPPTGNATTTPLINSDLRVHLFMHS